MQAYNPAIDILATIGATCTGPKIIVTWRGGQDASYSRHMLPLLAADPAAETIIDAETGELLYFADFAN